MITITLPDGSKKQFAHSPDGFAVASAIGAGLAKAALAVVVDGEMRDLGVSIEGDATVEIITRRSPQALEILRHDCAHVLAQAVQELYTDTQITFGPAIEDGFYYDFYREAPFSTDDFPAIEAKMREIIERDEPFTREIWQRQEAIDYFRAQGETFKTEHIESLPADVAISIYRQGAWLDLCRGPHLVSVGGVGMAFKLLKLSGTYWKGDAEGIQLQRIYGTCWRDDNELQAYLKRLQEAEQRDHRKIGRQLQLFHMQEEAIGSVFWHPQGWTLYRTIESYMRQRLEQAGYMEIKTPQLVDRKLWEASGHWQKFGQNMFITEVDEGAGCGDSDAEQVRHAHMKRHMALKPMNCPCHVQIFRQGIKSYRDLPLRLSEFGSCHRYEPSGALHGLMRVRAFVQDDGHIFCTRAQIIEETRAFCTLLTLIYKDFGFSEVAVKFSDRPRLRAGSDEIWDSAEKALLEAIKATAIPYELNPGEGAFYGPKLEFILRDTIGRDWQCGTWQVDFVLPQSLDAYYTASDGSRQRPVMLHRAILGSFERFIGILIEHYEGRFPLWLAPTQVVVASITEAAEAYAREILAMCKCAGLRVKADIRNEQIGYKIREHSQQKIPFIFVVGEREARQNTIAIRRLGGEQQQILDSQAAVKLLKSESRSPYQA